MSRKRMLSPDFWLDEELAAKSPHARLLYMGMWNLCDDIAATLPNEPGKIKAQIFPYEDSLNIRRLLVELSSNDHIVLFVGEDDKEYWFLPKFHKNQKIDHPSGQKYPQYNNEKRLNYTPSLPDGSESPQGELAPNINKYNINKINLNKINSSCLGDKKAEKKLFLENSSEIKLAKLLQDLILANNPKAKIPDLQKWATEVDLMFRRDSRTEEEIDFIIRFSQQDQFWKANILSMGKIREKFDMLFMKAKNQWEQKKSTEILSV